MRKILYLIIIIILLFNPFSYSFILYGENIQYFADGKGKIRVFIPSFKVKNKFSISGSSYYKNLLFEIKNTENGKTRQIPLLLNKEKFDVYYIFKDGKGKYSITIFGSNGGNSYKGLCYFTIKVISVTNIDFKRNFILNRKIIKYVKSVIGMKVGRGECWDLAAYPLDKYSADWNRPTNFGIELDPDKDEILAGDIIQMYNVKLKYKNRIEYFGLPQHTAIVYKVLSKGNYIIAHQNAFNKRYVILTKFNLNALVEGKLIFYRPIAGFISKK